MAGTVVKTSEYSAGPVHALVLTATADASAATFPTADLSAYGVHGTLLAIQTNPGAVAPTDDYDITLVDGDGIDRLDGVGLNRDTTSSERATITGAPWVAYGETLNLTIANNAVNSAVIVITLYYAPFVNTAPGFAQALSATVDSVAVGASATGGATPYKSLDLDETEEEVKATAGTVYGLYFFNAVTSKRYVKFYNATAANTTVGTTTPVMTIPIPANASDATAGWIGFGDVGVAFDTAISIACTTGLADNDTGAPGAADVVVVVIYK